MQPALPAPAGPRLETVGDALPCHRELLASEDWLTRYVESVLTSFSGAADHVSAEDVVQTVFLAVLEKLEESQRRDDGQPEWWTPLRRRRGYLRGVVWHTVRHVLRDPWNRRRIASVASTALQEAPLDPFYVDPAPGPEEQFDHELRVGRLERCLASLPDRDSTLLRLIAAGFSREQIAAMFHLSTTTVSKRYARAVTRLRRKWRAEQE